MPRTKPLTQAQRERKANEERRKVIADGLAVYKNRRQFTNEEFALERRMVTSAERRRRWLLADGVAGYKSRNKLTNAQLGREIGVGEKAASKLLGGEVVQLTGDQYYRAWRLEQLEESIERREGHRGIQRTGTN